MKIDLRHLRYIVAAAEYGSFRRAAVAERVKVSSLARRIRDFEDEIGAALFIRHSGGVCLTQTGRSFIGGARRVLQQLDIAVRDMGVMGRGESGKLRIGLYSSLASGFLADLVRNFCADHSGVRVDFVDGGVEDHLAAVRRYSLDVAFLSGTMEWPECETTPLWTEGLYLAMPESHRFAELPEVSWSKLRGKAFIVCEKGPGQTIYDYLVRKLSALGYHPNIQAHKVDLYNLLPLVALGQGLTVTSESTTASQFPGVTYRPISGEEIPFSAVWSARNDNPAFRRFLSSAKSLSRSKDKSDQGA